MMDLLRTMAFQYTDKFSYVFGSKKNRVGSMQIVAESVQVLNKVGLALPFLVTLTDDKKELRSEKVHLMF